MERHTTDFLALIFGALFAAVGLAVLAGWTPETLLRFELLIPVVAIAAGLGLVLSARRRT